MTTELNFFATCPLGVADMLAAELKACGATRAREMKAGVEFDGSLETAYRACLWSRTASRILMPIAQVSAHEANAMYEGLRRVDWSRHVSPSGTLAVDFQGTSLGIKHTQFGALKTKDAIVDQLREKFGERPSVDLERPDLRINVHVHREQATVAEPSPFRGKLEPSPRPTGGASDALSPHSLPAPLLPAALTPSEWELDFKTARARFNELRWFGDDTASLLREAREAEQRLPGLLAQGNIDAGEALLLKADLLEVLEPDAAVLPPDAELVPDAAIPDAAPPDEMEPDAAVPDSAAPDEGTPDAGAPVDASPVDSEPETGATDSDVEETRSSLRTAGEAIQGPGRRLDRFVASLLAMTG